MYVCICVCRYEEALLVYELIKQTGLKCTVVTYGILIKALMRSGLYIVCMYVCMYVCM